MSDPARNTLDDPKDEPIDLTTEEGKKLVAGCGGLLEKLTRLEGEDVLLGRIVLLGVSHHITLVRVDEDGTPTRDPENRLEDILAGDYGGPPLTVELPGMEGEWVLGVDPYRD